MKFIVRSLLSTLLICFSAHAEYKVLGPNSQGAISTNSCATSGALILASGTGGTALQCSADATHSGIISIDKDFGNERMFEVQDNNVDLFDILNNSGNGVQLQIYRNDGALIGQIGLPNFLTGFNLISATNFDLNLVPQGTGRVVVEDISAVEYASFDPTNGNISIFGQDPVLHFHATATLAQINADLTLLAGVSGRTIRIVDFSARVSGTFTTCTTVDVQDTNGTPVVIQSIAAAAILDGSVLKDGTANVTRGVGMWGDLTANEGIEVVNTGSDCAGGTSITFDIQYTID